MPKVTGADIIPGAGGFDDFTGLIIDAFFEANTYGGTVITPAISLQCMVESPDFEEPVRLGGFSCGGSEKWEIIREGRELSALKGDNRFRTSSNAGVFVNELCKVAGGYKPGDDRAATEAAITKGAALLASRGFLPTQAEFYIGLDSRWVKQGRKNPMSKADDPKPDIMVQCATDYVKIPSEKVVEAVAKSPAKAKAPAATAKTEAKAEAKAPAKSGYEIDPDTQVNLQALASGKTLPELKKAIVDKNAEPWAKDQKFRNFMFSGDGFKVLEESGVLTKGEDGKYQ